MEKSTVDVVPDLEAFSRKAARKAQALVEAGVAFGEAALKDTAIAQVVERDRSPHPWFRNEFHRGLVTLRRLFDEALAQQAVAELVGGEGDPIAAPFFLGAIASDPGIEPALLIVSQVLIFYRDVVGGHAAIRGITAAQ